MPGLSGAAQGSFPVHVRLSWLTRVPIACCVGCFFFSQANAAAAAANAAPPPTVDTSVLDEFQAENTRLQAAFDEVGAFACPLVWFCGTAPSFVFLALMASPTSPRTERQAKVEMKALKAQIRDVEEESSGRVSPDRFGSLEAEHAALQAAMAEVRCSPCPLRCSILGVVAADLMVRHHCAGYQATVEMKALKAQICGVEEECSGRVSPDRFENLKVEHTALQAAVAEVCLISVSTRCWVPCCHCCTPSHSSSLVEVSSACY